MNTIKYAITVELNVWRNMGDSWRDLMISLCSSMRKTEDGQLWFFWGESQEHLWLEMRSVMKHQDFRHFSTTWELDKGLSPFVEGPNLVLFGKRGDT